MITIEISATPAPSATKTLPHTQVPTRMPSEVVAPTPRPTPETGTMIYGGEYNDRAFDVLATDDGGTLIGGLANNTRLSHRITPGNARLIRTDSEGDIVWEKDYGGDDDAMLYSLIQVGEDEYVALGQIAASYARDEMDMYLIKING